MPDDFPREPLDQLQAYMAGRRFLVLTGAGISTPSGIPDYRDSDGVRRGRQPMMYQEFLAQAEARRRYWARAMLGWPRVRQARPNVAHEALAELQARQRISGLITQNVDTLHDQAGSQDVIELHGSLHRVLCLDCGQRSERQQIQRLMETETLTWPMSMRCRHPMATPCSTRRSRRASRYPVARTAAVSG